MHKSIWHKQCELPEFKKLQEDIKTDVLIIGGGISGILCAYFLEKQGISYVLAEGSSIASGITKNTTAKLTLGHGLIYDTLINKFGEEKAQMYLRANADALAEYEKLCKNTDCDFEKKDSYIYSLKSESKIHNEVLALNRLGFNAEFIKECELPFKIKGAVKIPLQAQFNPLKFVCKISENLNIYENCFISEIKGTTAYAQNFRIEAQKIIIATHFPFLNSRGSYFLKMYQHRSYVSAYKNAAELRGMYVDEELGGLSFRNYGKYLLIGGGGHRTGKSSTAWEQAGQIAKKHYPKAELCCSWAAQDCITLDAVPYIGNYSKNTPNLFVITGFNKWGFTSSMAGAKILCDMVQEKKNPYAEVFSPQRSILEQQLFVNGFEAAVNLLTPGLKRCPHLGCTLKWNKYEHSWDCPCHGSRFERGGKLIDNPATKDARI